ncbi:MAG: cyclodeaminase/cyclohydrolase family protein [Pelosinus sp.]|nr:cyclodeaminase/cyclohydrolase family protein [Pelosinus sp.]
MLVNLNIVEFANKVASAKSVMPAGGCVAALSGLMGVCLCAQRQEYRIYAFDTYY